MGPDEKAYYGFDFDAFCDDPESDDNGDFEMFPDHECPWDIAMIRNA
jgi:hypothetical protein